MQEPTYKPGQWVVYQQLTAGGFGEIIGGRFDGEVWHYTVQSSQKNSDAIIVAEEIKYTLEGGHWMPPNNIIGNSSVYAQVEQ